MRKFIGVESSHRGLIAEIDLGYICNYNCSYCADRYHDGKIWIDYNYLKKFISKVKPSSIIILGGEPTIYPDFIPLLKFIKDETKGITTVVSNASRSLKWWEENHHLIDLLVFSFHIEHANINEFINKILSLCSSRPLTVNLPMIPKRFDECLKMGHKIVENCSNVSVSLKALTDNKGGFAYYTNDQYKIMSTILQKNQIFSNPYRIETFKLYSDGTKNIVTAQQLISTKEIRYTGWKCWKGLNMLKILPEGEIYQSTCEVSDHKSKPIGNIYDLYNVKWTTEPQICKLEICKCFTALKSLKKEKI